MQQRLEGCVAAQRPLCCEITIGEYVRKLTVGVTAFIDILGFGGRVLNAESKSEIEAIKQSVKTIRDAFDHKARDDTIRSSQKFTGAEILAFSDSVIVNIPLESGATKFSGTFDPIMSEIVGFAYAQGQCVLNGIFLRGGIDLGWWQREGAIVISQSLTRAYKHEGECCFPVISITDDLQSFLTGHGDRKFYAKDTDPIRTSFSKTKVGSKTITFIDYIGICVESLDWRTSTDQWAAYRAATPEGKQEIANKGIRENVERWLTQHASRISDAYVASSGAVREKYEWLASYHNTAAKKFSKNPSCRCDLSRPNRRRVRRPDRARP